MFRFKHFAIEQDRTPMKVGTDGVLLGAWVAVSGGERHILDIGTGTGVIALMMAQRSSAHVDAVEIDAASASQAQENVDASPWCTRVTIHHTEIQSFAPTSEGYDLIVTNPPYFVDSLLSPDAGRTTARHTTDLSFSDLVKCVARLLNPEGRLAIILPTQEADIFQREAAGQLSVVRRCDVFSRDGAPTKRVMCEYKLGATTAPPRAEEITIESGRPPQFTAEYRELTRDFYLKF